MAKEIADFPGQIWDGLSRNEQRTNTLDNIEPNPEDWNKIVAEMIETQTYITNNLGSSDVVALLADGSNASTGVQKFTSVYQDWVDVTFGSPTNFDLSLGNKQRVTLTGNPNLTISNVQGAQSFTIRLTQDGMGSRSVTWFSGISWAGGVVPTLIDTADKADMFQFVRTGTDTYDGFVIGQDI